MRIVITGSNGQVGHAVGEELVRKSAGRSKLIRLTRRELDLAAPHTIAERLQALKPDIIINPAAYTAVDRAESEPGLAHAVNSEAVEVLGQYARTQNIPMIHFSTDYVFDGRANAPYPEDCPSNPLSVYGVTKAEGEKRLLETGADCLVIRTAWVYSASGQNFLTTIVRLALEQEELTIVADQFGSPTSASQIARFVSTLVVSKTSSLASLFAKAARVVHFTATGVSTWHGFASAIVASARRRGLPVKAQRIKPITAADYPTPAARPRYSQLSLERLRTVFEYEPEAWQHALEEVLDAMTTSATAKN
jgi:dTDP-4-dehydrorhamnose reductase